MEQDNARTTLMELATERGVSLAALSGFIGRNSSYLQQFVKKGSPRKLEESDRRKLAQFFGVDESRLGRIEEKSLGLMGKASHRHWCDVPRLALDVSAGPGAEAAEEQPFGALRFSQEWLRSMGLNPANLVTMAVAGDSMWPVLNDGDEILVDRSRRALRDGIHVLRVGDHLLVKRVDMGHPGCVRLKSDNSAYDPLDLAPEDVVVIGRVVWKGGRL